MIKNEVLRTSFQNNKEYQVLKMKCKYGHEMPENEFLCSQCFVLGRTVTVLGEIRK